MTSFTIRVVIADLAAALVVPVGHAQEDGISGERLTPRGVGPLAPIGSNDSEAGRALNRRVELVKK